MDDHTTTIELSQDAAATVQAMRDKLAAARAGLPADDQRVVQMANSLAFSLAQVLGLGGRIAKDGELSLVGVTAYGFVYGVVWFPTRNVAPLPDGFVGEWSVHS